MFLSFQVHSGQQQLLQLWQIKKGKLEQCLKLRIFEQDCEKVKAALKCSLIQKFVKYSNDPKTGHTKTGHSDTRPSVFCPVFEWLNGRPSQMTDDHLETGPVFKWFNYP